MLVVGGSVDSPFSANSDSLDTAEFYDPASGTWTLTGRLHYARSNHAASVLKNGEVLITGGYDILCQNTSELYYPS